MKKKIVVAKRLPEPIESLINDTFDVLFLDNVNEETYQDFLGCLGEAEGLLITSALKFNDEILNYVQKLKAVSTIAVGYDNIPVEVLSERGIIVTNTPDILTETTADTIFGLLLSTARRFPELDRFVKNGNWKNIIGEELFGVDVHGKTIGIVGLGSIGEAIAKRANLGFGMQVFYHNRSRNEIAEEKYSAIYKDLGDLCQESDFVCLTVPLTNETQGLISLREIKKMKKTAILINGSRGKVVVEEDLVEALHNDLIRAVGLDVYENEPIHSNHPLLQFDKAVTLPHVGSATHETRFNMAQMAVNDLLKVLKGESPLNAINKI